MDTNRLIDALVADLKPVRSLAPTWRRVVVWLALALPPTAIIVALMGLRPDLYERLNDELFLGQALAMLATALVGAYAALTAVIPGARRIVMAAPAIPLAGWMALLAYQWAWEWSRFGSAGTKFGLDVECIPAIAIIGVSPLAVMIGLIRKGAPHHRALAVFWGTLAAAATANTALRLFHPVDSALMVIAWQFGSVMAFSGLATLARNRLVPSLTVLPIRAG